MRAEEIITVVSYYNEALLQQRNSTKCISYEINTSKPIYTILRWPRALSTLQLQKTHANRKSTSKSRKHFHNFDSRWYKCSQIHFICSAFLFWLCCEHLQRVHCQIDESLFLICRCFFLFAARFFFGLCCEHLQRVCCQIEEVVSLIYMCFLKLQRVELSRPP